jgi:nucleoside-diphosphate-sugar epimerase
VTTRIVVTGTTGFIGSRALARWRERTDMVVTGVARVPGPSVGAIEMLQADLLERGWTKTLPHAADVVVHLAQSRRYSEFPEGSDDMVRINIDATAELLEWARLHGVRRFVLASTGIVYRPSTTEVAEDAPCEPQSMYAATKLAGEYIAHQYASYFDISILRLFGVYGPGQSRGLVRTIIDRLRNGQEITLAGGIGIKIAPLYVEDCISVLDHLIEVGLRGVVNLSGPRAMTLRDIACACADFGKWEASLRDTEAAPLSLLADISKAKTVFPELALTWPNEGLAATVAAVAQNNSTSIG